MLKLQPSAGEGEPLQRAANESTTDSVRAGHAVRDAHAAPRPPRRVPTYQLPTRHVRSRARARAWLASAALGGLTGAYFPSALRAHPVQARRQERGRLGQAAFAARFRACFGREPTVSFRFDFFDDPAMDSLSADEVLDTPFLDEAAPPAADASLAGPPKRVFVQIMHDHAGFPSFGRSIAAIGAVTTWDVYVEVEAIRFTRLLGNAPAPAVDAFVVDVYDDMPAAPGRFYDERVVWCLSDDVDDTEEVPAATAAAAAAAAAARSRVWLVVCSSCGEGAHVLGVFARTQDAKAFAAQPHDAAACPRTWGDGSEAAASALTGEPGHSSGGADAGEHELEVAELEVDHEPLSSVFVMIIDSIHIGEHFVRAFSTKEAAMCAVGRGGLAPDAQMPCRGSAHGVQGNGETRTLLRAYPVRR